MAAAPTPAPVAAAPAPQQAPSATPVPVATPVATASPATAATAASSANSPFVTAEGVAALTGMGFPESESRAALAAAMGNADLAYEYLLTGIPPAALQNAAAMGGGGGRAAPAATIDDLRRHPQFNELKRLIQQNPEQLSRVLDLIGQQNPDLLAAIHANNDGFIAMMNEPIIEGTPAASATNLTGSVPPTAGMGMGMPGMAGMPGMPGLGDPSQMIQLLSSLPAPQRAQLAQSMGMAPEQIEGFLSMLQSVPPEQLQSILQSGRGAGGMPGGADPPGVIRLTEEEMAAVNRLVALGFSQQQAAQAYLACDKNEALAANLLLEGGWGDDDGDMGGFDGGDGGDDMYN